MDTDGCEEETRKKYISEPMSMEVIHRIRIFASKKIKGIRQSSLTECKEYCFELFPDKNLRMEESTYVLRKSKRIRTVY